MSKVSTHNNSSRCCNNQMKDNSCFEDSNMTADDYLLFLLQLELRREKGPVLHYDLVGATQDPRSHRKSKESLPWQNGHRQK